MLRFVLLNEKRTKIAFDTLGTLEKKSKMFDKFDAIAFVDVYIKYK